MEDYISFFFNSTIKDQSHKSLVENLITENSVGLFKLGMYYDDIKQLAAINEFKVFHHYGTEGSCDIPFVLILDKFENILIQVEFDSIGQVNLLWAMDSRYSTEEGVYPGMKVSDFLSLNSNPRQYMHHSEMFGSVIFFTSPNGKLFFPLRHSNESDSNRLYERYYPGIYPSLDLKVLDPNYIDFTYDVDSTGTIQFVSITDSFINFYPSSESALTRAFSLQSLKDAKIIVLIQLYQAIIPARL